MNELEKRLVALDLQLIRGKESKRKAKQEVKALRARNADPTNAERTLETIRLGLKATKAERKSVVKRLMEVEETEEVG